MSDSPLKRRLEEITLLRVALQCGIGVLGGGFIGVFGYVHSSYREEIGLVALVFGCVASGGFAFSRYALLRILAWSAAGAAVGDIALALAAGGLSVGTVFTLSGVVMAVVGAIIGYRTVPPGRAD